MANDASPVWKSLANLDIVGVHTVLSNPAPNNPFLLFPQTHKLLLISTANETFQPAYIYTIFSSRGSFSGSVTVFFSAPSPSYPISLLPQAYTFPL